jgi:phage terminase large subunit
VSSSTPLKLQIKTPRWSVPLLRPAALKGAKGGRSSGKSHFFAEALVEDHIINKDLQTVCIREIQKSLKFSAKKLIESKIREMGVAHLFETTLTEIRRRGGDGIVIFQGMQDHTADSIKSLEGFDRAFCEEAQSLSSRSIELLVPTIRKEGSEIWCAWNPDQPTDAVEQLFRDTPDAILVHVNYTDNPMCPQKMRDLAERQKKLDYEKYAHIWLGGYNTKSDAQIFNGRWRVDEFQPMPGWEGPYQGLDFGFSVDPTAAVRCWVYNRVLYIEYEAGDIGLDLDKTTDYLNKHIPGFANFQTRADSARPESISYLSRHGLPKLAPVKKWSGSVVDGIEHIKTYDEIVIHTRCKQMQEEARLYSYKVDKRSGDILPDIEDDHNHYWDAVRYALGPMIRQASVIFEPL